MQYIGYYRVSTQRQEISGLGLAGQQTEVRRFVGTNRLLAEYTDIESGSKSNREQLLKAIEHAKQEDATLVIAKLDRLSRDVQFISTLMKTKVQFKCCDMPDATPLTIHIFAAMAEWELERISTRIKAGLNEAKIKGVKLGNPKADKAFMDKIRLKRKPKEITEQQRFIIKSMISTNTLDQIAQQFNNQSIKTTRGKKFTAVQVHRLIKKLK